MASTVNLDQTLLWMGFTQPEAPTQFVKRVHGGQIIVTVMVAERRVRINARLDDGSFILSQGHAHGTPWRAIENSLNKALALLIAQAKQA